jgi:hypothetical protein
VQLEMEMKNEKKLNESVNKHTLGLEKVLGV